MSRRRPRPGSMAAGPARLGRPTTTSAPPSSSSRPPAGRSSSQVVASSEPARPRISCASPTLLQVPIIAAWRRGDVVSNDDPLYLGMAGIGAPAVVRERLAAADAMLVIGSRLNEPTSADDTIPTPTTRWIHVDIEPAAHPGPSTPERTVTADARIFLRAANDRLVGKAVLDAERVKERQTHNAADRAAWEAATVVDGEAWDGPGVHPGQGHHDAAPRPARRRDPDHRRGQLRRLGRARLPVPPTGHVPRPDVRGHGLRPAGGHRRRPRPSRSTGRRARRRRRPGDDHGRAGDRGPGEGAGHRRGLRQRAVRHDPDVAGAPRHRTGHRDGARAGRLRRPSHGVSGPVASVSIATPTWRRAMRQAMVEERPTVIQLALDRRWVSVDEVADA